MRVKLIGVILSPADCVYTLSTVPGRNELPQLINQRHYDGSIDPRRRLAVQFKTVQNAVKRFAMLLCAIKR